MVGSRDAWLRVSRGNGMGWDEGEGVVVDVDRVTGGCEATVLFGSAGIILHAIDARQRDT